MGAEGGLRAMVVGMWGLRESYIGGLGKISSVGEVTWFVILAPYPSKLLCFLSLAR